MGCPNKNTQKNGRTIKPGTPEHGTTERNTGGTLVEHRNTDGTPEHWWNTGTPAKQWNTGETIGILRNSGI